MGICDNSKKLVRYKNNIAEAINNNVIIGKYEKFYQISRSVCKIKVPNNTENGIIEGTGFGFLLKFYISHGCFIA